MVLNGRALAKKVFLSLREELDQSESKPGLAVVLIGEDPASQVYVSRKHKRAARLGFYQETHRLPVDTSQADLLSMVDRLNRDERIHGILVQLPLPKHIDSDRVLEAIAPHKDVDGFHPYNAGLLSQGRGFMIPCTAKGVIELLKEGDIPLSGKSAVVIGRSNIVGRPVAQLLEQNNCTVTVCHSRTQDLPALLQEADIVVAAIGRPSYVKAEWLKKGAVVVDVGINRLDDGSLCGDVDYEAATKIASAITPVPGGVGPMTIAMLMQNTYLSWKRSQMES
ncbi:MAG: bifunctional methylenetetrahydrofolate dehydrogenase/methenyltetrahydrofolate cyclohydrolase FolD [Myxococcota bacterium]|nr:bifunctional methylenetetrahydrofolate dehydrogenase/methenyltetrahydrofolate cyclohydrolase FolD [Myxococcota bacterium]